MPEHTPIEVDEEVGRMRDVLARAYEVTSRAYRESPDPDGDELTDDELQAIADRLAEVAVRADDLAESLVEQLRERSRERALQTFFWYADWPLQEIPDHDRLGNRTRWYWCGDPDCPDCQRRGVVPPEQEDVLA